jgi:hypothetical protein
LQQCTYKLLHLSKKSFIATLFLIYQSFYPNLSKTVLASNDLLDLDMSGQNTLNNLMAVHTAQQQQQHQTQNIMAQFNQVVSVFVPETKFALARRCEYVGPAAAQPVYDKPNATDLST